MRSSGILRSWNEERGFGFIAPAHGGAELFVHVSAFPRDGSRPVVGETLSFELGRGPDGRPQAVKVVRGMVGDDAPARRVSAVTARRSGPSLLGTGVLVLALVAAGSWGYSRFKQSRHRQELQAQPAQPQDPVTAPAGTAPSYRCDGRTQCSQMTSCAEATWFINHCPGTQMDGNGDGVPCEQQWCKGPGAH
jgi:cold shock CspA family protein